MSSRIVKEHSPFAPPAGNSAESWKQTSEEVLAFIENSSESLSLRGVEPGALAFLISRSLRALRKPYVLIAPSDREAEKYADMLAFFWGRDEQRADAPLDRRVWLLPSRTGHNAQWLGKMESTARRLEALYALRAAPAPNVIVTSA
ncbi:MAG: hypothetical protein HGA63_02845, partial [Syntrophobacteraceae bacterium]|nr:hypothetical protein [Syntrophobacteraceae bacterium]